MLVDKILENCRIVNTREIIDGDIAINDGKIVQVSRNLSNVESDERINIDGRIVIPGMIDPHVHFRDPGQTHKEDFSTGSMSAAFGGVTTAFDMPNNKEFVDSLDVLERKRKAIQGKSYIDYGLFAAVSKKNLDVLNQFNCMAFKAYMAERDIIGYKDLEYCLKNLNGKVISVHAEDPGIIEKDGRVPEAELKCVEKVLGMDFNNNKVHFCHVTTKPGLERILQDKKASCEVTTHHLYLDDSMEKELGSLMNCYPPVRSKAHVNGLWSLIGRIDCMGSDHAPHTLEEKKAKKPAGGFPGVETALPLLIDAVNQDRINWQELVRLTSHGAMEIFNLKDKGEIEAGKDADIVVIDNSREWTISAENLHSKCNWTPYEGWPIKGSIEKVFLRGELIIDGGELIGRKGFGKEL